MPDINCMNTLRRFVHDTMDVESVESRFSDMSLSPFGGHGNYAHSDGQLSGSPYKGGSHSMLHSPYSTAGSKSADSWHAQRAYERPLGTYSRPSELLHILACKTRTQSTTRRLIWLACPAASGRDNWSVLCEGRRFVSCVTVLNALQQGAMCPMMQTLVAPHLRHRLAIAIAGAMTGVLLNVQGAPHASYLVHLPHACCAGVLCKQLLDTSYRHGACAASSRTFTPSSQDWRYSYVQIQDPRL